MALIYIKPLIQYEELWFDEILECLDENIKFVTVEIFSDSYAFCCHDMEDTSCQPKFKDDSELLFYNYLDDLVEIEINLVKSIRKELKKVTSQSKNKGVFFSRVPIEIPGYLAAKFGIFWGLLGDDKEEIGP